MGNKPEVLAPAAIVTETNEGAIMAAGTSFATPLVTAALSETIAGLRDVGETVAPQLLRRVVIEGADPLDDGSEKKFNAETSLYYAYDRLGLGRPHTQYQSREGFY